MRSALDSFVFFICMMVPLAAIWIVRKPALDRESIWLLYGLVISTLLNIVIGSKKGSGHHHLMPLITVYLFAAIKFLTSSGRSKFSLRQSTVAGVILLAAVLAYSHDGTKMVKQEWADHGTLKSEHAKMAELNAMLKDYPQAQIGISDNIHYSDSWYRPLAIYQNAPLHFDFAAWLDVSYGGGKEADIIWMVDGCRIPAWIIPVGEPFTATNWYKNDMPMFSDRFRDTFKAHYALIETGKTYQVWACRAGLKPL
jgi:hypothetical protein